MKHFSGDMAKTTELINADAEGDILFMYGDRLYDSKNEFHEDQEKKGWFETLAERRG